MGYCFGGTVALELTRSGAPVAGVVTFHGGLGTPRPQEAGTDASKGAAYDALADARSWAELRRFLGEVWP